MPPSSLTSPSSFIRRWQVGQASTSTAKVRGDAAAKANQPAPPEAQTLQGAFKTPSLRGVGLTGPYFHDGHAQTLEEAVDAMLKGGTPNPQLDEKLKPANLTPKQRADLLAFLKAITPDNNGIARRLGRHGSSSLQCHPHLHCTREAG